MKAGTSLLTGKAWECHNLSGFSRRCRYALPALPILSKGRKISPDAKGRLAFAQLPKLVKTPRHALPAVAAGNTADAAEGNDSDSSYDEHDSYNNDSDAPLVDDD